MKEQPVPEAVEAPGPPTYRSERRPEQTTVLFQMDFPFEILSKIFLHCLPDCGAGVPLRMSILAK